jgi:hypothetical protein
MGVSRAMGQLRLIVHDRDRIPPGGLEHVHMVGPDDLPWFGRAFFSGDQLVIERNESDSGRVFVPWQIDGAGQVLVGTSTLMERDRPYLLEVELARGMVNNLRNHMAQWEMMGLTIPDALRSEILEGTRQFSRASTTQNEGPTAADWAEQSLATSLEAMKHLAAEYAEQALDIRRNLARAATPWFGVRLGDSQPSTATARQLSTAFNMVSVPTTWRKIQALEGRRDWEVADAQVQWAQQAGLRVCAGPLLELDDRGVPDWTYLWEGDLNSLLSFMLDHVHKVVERYRGQVHLWQVAARMTHGHALGLSEEARLQVAAKAIGTVRQLDPTTPVVVTFDQPWAEFLANEQLDLAPLHFADALTRADLGLSGIGLEIDVGYHPGGSIARGPLAISRLIDTWSLLELPLLVALTVPSSSGRDPQANEKVQVLTGPNEEITPETQKAWIEQHVPVLLAKNTVQVILWNQLSDAEPHHFPHGGLLDAQNQPKPALEALRIIRQKYFAPEKK